MLGNDGTEESKLIQIGESILNQNIDINHKNNEKHSEFSQNDNLYLHVVQLSNFLQTLNSNDPLQESDVHQVLHFLTNIYQDLKILQKIPSPDVGQQSPVDESYKTLAYTLFLLLKNHNIEFHIKSKEQNINLNKNNSFLENSTELLNFLAEEYDLPRNLTEKEIITTIKEYKKNENSLSFSPKRGVDSEIKSLKMKIEKLEKSKNENENLKEKTDALLKINEVQKREIKKLKKQNQSLQSQVNMAITEALSISKATSQDNFDELNRARLNLLENDIKSIKDKYNELQEKKRKLSSENQQLKIEIQKLIECEKQKDTQIIELKHALTKLKIDNEQLNNSNDINRMYDNNTEIKIKAGENKKLNDALIEMSKHLKSLSSEISIESNKSNILYELCQKLIMSIDKYDFLLKSKEKESMKNQILLSECQSVINSLKNQQAERKSNQLDDKDQLIDEIEKYLAIKSISPQLNDEIMQIISTPNPTIQKVLNIIELLLNTKTTSEISQSLEQQNDRLINFCFSLLQFFEKLANSGEMQQWIIGSPQDDTFRPLLLSQCNRIESYLKKFNSELDLNYDDFFNFPSRIEKLINNELQPQPQEVILLIHLCSTANDALRRYASNLGEENRALRENVSELRHELQQCTNECHFTFDDLQKSRESICSQTERTMNPKLLEVIDVIQESPNNENDAETINRIIDILNPNSKKKEAKNESKKKQIHSLTHENDRLRNELTELKQQNLECSSQIKLIMKENVELKKNENNYQIQLSQMQQIIEEQKMKMNSANSGIDNKSELIETLKEEIEVLKTKCSTLEVEKNNQKSSLKREFSKNISKIQKENEELASQNDRLKTHYEKLLNELQLKLNELVESESKLTNELKSSNLKLSQISSELTTTRVENKMLKLRISASDEKMQREKNLLETHFRMDKLNSETKHETDIEKLKAEYDRNFHDFLVSICERFKDFFDFNQTISEYSVQNLLNGVETELKNRKDRLAIFELYSNEMNSVRSILGINDSEPVVPIISKMIQKLNDHPIEIQNESSDESFNDQSASDWEQWAKKLLLMASDNLAPAQSSKYIRYAIEEVVMAGISQRSLIKKINILRSEKFLLKNGKNYVKNRNRRLNLNTLLLVLACIRRLQINSCHLPPNIPKPNLIISDQNSNLDENRNDNDGFSGDKDRKPLTSQKTKKKNYPIIS